MHEHKHFVKILADIIIVVLVALLAAALVEWYQPVRRPASPITRGSRVSLPAIDWAQPNPTLILALSKDCHYCSASAPFYSLLLQIARGRGVRLIVLSPQPVPDVKGWLDSLYVYPAEIRRSKLRPIGITATPTLLLANEVGVVTDVWS